LPFALFFRDPRRRIPSDEDAIVSPADGVVKDISIAPSPFDSNEKFKRIGIFLSVLDVHINRMPSNLMVKDIKYSEGKFHDARSPLAASENESNSLLCDAQFGDLKFPLIVKQISGAIARRIVSEAKIGAKFEKGAKFGMIKFGSRTELYLPEKTEFNISVKVGDKVFAGSTILAKIRR
jgi:phosphatidylserine decarboxylase